MDHKKSLETTDKVLSSLWTIGVAVAIWLIVVIIIVGLKDLKGTAPLVGAFAILISAGIASASVMKSIHTAKINDIEKAEKEKERKRIFALKVMETIHLTVESLKDSAGKEFIIVAHLDFKESMETVNKLLESIFSESILPFLSENEQKNVSVFYREFKKFSFIKQLSHPDMKNDKEIEEFMLLIKDYKKIFTKFSQEYIEEYKKTKEL